MSRTSLLLATAIAGGAIFGMHSAVAYGQMTAMPLTTADPRVSDYAPVDPGYAPPMNAVPADGLYAPAPGAVYAPQFAAGPNGYYSPGIYPGQWFDDSSWHWILFPHGWMYPTYLASMREARLGAQVFHERNQDWLVDPVIGARVGFLRYGTDDLIRPEGFQIDVEAAVLPRFTLDRRRQFQSEDFRAGIPLTLRLGPVEGKLAYAHYSSHLGDMFMEDNPGVMRSPYTRDSVVLGLGVRPREDFRLYAEADYAFHTFGNTKHWQFQFGIDWSTLQPTGFRGAPFFAINGMIRQDVDYSGNLTVQTGWQWRGQAGQLLRTGFEYFNGKSNQGQFFDRFEEQIGLGMWYDF